MAEITEPHEPSSDEDQPKFDPAGFDQPEPEQPDDEDELNTIEAELDALSASQDSDSEEEHSADAEAMQGRETDQSSTPSGSSDASGATRISPASEASDPSTPSRATTEAPNEEIKRMREARRKAREEGLRRGPPPTPGARPNTPWAKNQSPGASGPNPFRDSRVAQAEAAGGPPAWLGTRWREIEPEDQREAWVYLRRWVDWLVNEYRLYESVVPRCWYRHTQLVEELYAAMCMEHKAWEEGAASLTPMMMWHPNLEAMRNRLMTAVGELGPCGKGTHKPEERIELEYDEELWRRTAYGRREATTVVRPPADQGPHLVRARIYDDEGTEIMTDEQIVGVRPIQGAEHPSVLLRRDRTTATAESKIELEAEAIPRAKEVIWERAEDWSTDEQGALVAVDWKPLNQEETSDDDQDESDNEEQTAEPRRDPREIPKESRL